MFQSLLSWIGFKDNRRSEMNLGGRLRFNPCCRGLGSKTAGASQLRIRIDQVSILVVVDWVQRLERQGHDTTTID